MSFNRGLGLSDPVNPEQTMARAPAATGVEGMFQQIMGVVQKSVSTRRLATSRIAMGLLSPSTLHFLPDAGSVIKCLRHQLTHLQGRGNSRTPQAMRRTKNS